MPDNLIGNFDAQVWADAWLETLASNIDIATDRATMIGWFANAIMAGYDHAKNEITKEALNASPTLSASEAIYGFAGWLTTRNEITKMGAVEGCAEVAELVAKFCEANHLASPREQWDKLLTHPKEV